MFELCNNVAINIKVEEKLSNPKIGSECGGNVIPLIHITQTAVRTGCFASVAIDYVLDCFDSRLLLVKPALSS